MHTHHTHFSLSLCKFYTLGNADTPSDARTPTQMHTPTHIHTHTISLSVNLMHLHSLCSFSSNVCLLSLGENTSSRVLVSSLIIAINNKTNLSKRKWKLQFLSEYEGHSVLFREMARGVIALLFAFSCPSLYAKQLFFQRAMKKNEHLLTVHTTEVACFSSSSLRFDSRHSQEFFSCCCEDL